MFGEILPSGLGRYVVKRNCWQTRDEGMDGQTTDNGHPMITKALLARMTHVSLKCSDILPLPQGRWCVYGQNLSLHYVVQFIPLI